jgi:4,5-dihydroxyphthalate decarboxylase
VESDGMQWEVQGGDYEHVLGLFDDAATRDSFRYLRTNVGALSKVVLSGADFDVAEYSLANHIMLHARGERRLSAIPVFPSRAFRNGSLFVPLQSGLRKFEQLAGKRIGVSEFAMTTAVWTRGHIQDLCGLDWRSVEWITGPSPRFPAPAGFQVSACNEDLEELLCAGQLDAIMTGRPKDHQKPAAQRRLRSLTDDAATQEGAYFEGTGLFPIMHAVVLHARAAAETGRAKMLFDAYVVAKRAALTRRLGAAFLPGAERLWDGSLVDGADAVRYGLTPLNRRNIEALSRYLHEQKLIDAIPPVESLFVAGAADWVDP